MAVDPLIEHVFSLWMAAYLGVAAIGKLRDTAAFTQAVAAYRLLPASAVAPIAKALPYLELLVAAAWLIPLARPLAALASALLLVVFATAIAVNLTRGRSHIDCGCNVRQKQRLSWWLVFRNLALTILGLCMLLPTTGRHLSVVDALLVVIIAGFGYLVSVLVPMVMNNSNHLKRGVQQ
jgi:uncharacterized membrane protein YphA (DoxX/SURF4 family)